ncbi:hypothetical protein [Natrinema sp. H-ect4]|uniref:hypothetical protein n=1 Tax=Natrinema sp. H-ect4 TaxID=3242699 RepID=UPI0035A99510
MTEVQGVDEATAEDLLEDYDYPGEIFTDLHFSTATEDRSYPDLPVDDVTQLHREMIQAGINYYTGKEVYREATQPPPSDGLRFSYPDREDEEYELLGKTTDDLAHYWRDVDQFLEVKRFEHTLEGELEQVEDDTDRFTHLRTHYLQRYIKDREWDILREPDYSEIRENTELGSGDLPDETEQTKLSDLR